ncbi:twin-arginine translocation signal domain-containing protein [Lactonifactor sp. BIOML-A3]|nr:twin-arginine translocation signal domain-containing protein [Lactonifactor sp. BIOML-A5]MSA10144.1 twin-arginine translocation signal domain-containing protein [Lactonifactor sp. BIOML-A4]MSA14650.1 twin-arginine translocation signal domain-containing protein [Lactonifactor sp. BIOML-A3]MSA19072.1 twin-arginine translocation signal domain-containing protein [Lactonifactor sp. BIOML-A2]MSA39790.1 twin-arginine translocation signal domain-containing protein [Lactonifactor sp. BIOML-A1]MSB155
MRYNNKWSRRDFLSFSTVAAVLIGNHAFYYLLTYPSNLTPDRYAPDADAYMLYSVWHLSLLMPG